MTKKNYQQLSESERHAIALGLQQKQSLSAIVRALGRAVAPGCPACPGNKCLMRSQCATLSAYLLVMPAHMPSTD